MKSNTFENINYMWVFFSHVFSIVWYFSKNKIDIQFKEICILILRLNWHLGHGSSQSTAVCCYQTSVWAFIRYWVCIWSMCNSKYGQMCCDANTDYNGRSQVDSCYERSHPINLIAWLWLSSIHQLINGIFCLLKVLFSRTAKL